jgi:hypothetical protein
MNIPEKLPETGLHGKTNRKVNAILDWMKSNQIRDTETMSHDRTTNGIFPRARAGTGGSSTTQQDAVWS